MQNIITNGDGGGGDGCACENKKNLEEELTDDENERKSKWQKKGKKVKSSI